MEVRNKLEQVHNNLIHAVVAQMGEIDATTIWQVSGTTKAEGEESATVLDKAIASLNVDDARFLYVALQLMTLTENGIYLIIQLSKLFDSEDQIKAACELIHRTKNITDTPLQIMQEEYWQSCVEKRMLMDALIKKQIEKDIALVESQLEKDEEGIHRLAQTEQQVTH